MGRPYFVMELVRGIRITDYCDQNNLSTRDRLDLFMKVVQAVQHAHQKGIIHRDLKPSNVLITLHDGVPVPKVIDFGIAKALEQKLTDKTLFTQFEQFIGTPAYTSPEQAEMSGLDIDTRSDIYSLGVLLYELLVGKTPFDAQALVHSGLDEMRRIIREQEPARPSTRLSTMLQGEVTTTAQRRRVSASELVHLLKGDLDWVVMKCLEKDRTRRYDTANGLAVDIQRHLNNEPVVARPPSRTYRLGKLVRRNKLVFTASAAVAMALVAGMTASLIGVHTAIEEKKRTVAAKIEAERQTEIAVGALNEKKTALADMYALSGITAEEAGNQADAILWFAGAAQHSLTNSTQARVNRSRFENWAAKQPYPTFAIRAHFRPDVLQFHPSGQYLLLRAFPEKSSGATNSVLVCDLKGGNVLQLGALAQQPIVAAWNSQGDELAVSCQDGSAQIVSFPSLALRDRIPTRGAASAVAFSDSGRYVAFGESNLVALIDRGGGRADHRSVAVTGRVTSLAFGLSDTRLAVGIDGSSASLFALPSGAIEKVPVFGPVAHVSKWPPLLASEPPALIVQALRNSVQIINLSSNAPVQDLKLSPGPISYYTLDSDRGFLWVCGFHSAEAWRWPERFAGGTDKSQGTPKAAADLVHKNYVKMIDFIGTTGQILTASSDGTMRIWDWTRDRAIPAFTVPHQTEVISCKVSPDGRHFATGQSDGLVRVWAAIPAEQHRRIPLTSPSEGRVAVTIDGTALTIAGGVGFSMRTRTESQVFSAQSGKPISAKFSAPGPINGAAFSPDGSVVAFLGGAGADVSLDKWTTTPGYIAGWHWRDGELSFPIVETQSQAVDGAYHPKTGVLAVACAAGEMIFLSRGPKGMEKIVKEATCDKASYRVQPRRWVKYSPSGQFLVQVGLKRITVWHAERQEPLWSFDCQAPILDCTFSSNENLIAFGTGSEATPRAFVCEAGTGLQVMPALRQTDWFMSVDFDPEGRYLLTSSRDRTVRLWDLKSREVVRNFPTHDEVIDANFFGDGQWIIATVRDAESSKGRVRLWNVHSPLRAAPDIVLRGFLPNAIQLTSGDRAAIVSGVLSYAYVLDLPVFKVERSSWSAEEQTSRAELIAGKQLSPSGLIKLTTEEWLKKWEAMRSSPAR